MRLPTVALLVVAVAAGAACSGSEDREDSNGSRTSAAPACPTGGEGTYVNAPGTVRVTIPAPDTADTAALASLGAAVDAPSPAFVAVEVDNSDGTGTLYVGSVVVVTDDGGRVTFEEPTRAIGEWQDRVPQGDSSTYNRFVAEYNARLDADTALAGEKKAATYVSSEPPRSVKNVLVDGQLICRA